MESNRKSGVSRSIPVITPFVFAVVILLGGCSTWRINKLVKKLKKDMVVSVEDGPAKLSETMKLLVAEGGKAVKPLLGALSEDDRDLRLNISIMIILDALGPEVPPKTFIRLLTHPGLWVPGCAAEAIKARPDGDFTGALLEVMESNDPARHRAPPADVDAFRHAVACLGEVGDGTVLQELIPIVDHPDAQSRQYAMRAVLKLSVRHEVDHVSSKIMDRLISNLTDTDANVRYVASYVLTGLTGEKIGTLSRTGKAIPGTNDREIRIKWENWWARNRAEFAP